MLGFHGGARMPAFVASGASKSTYARVDGANMVIIELPAFASALATSTANVYVEGAQESDATFRRIVDEGNYSAGAGISDWEIPSTTGDRMIICRPAKRFNYIRMAFSTAATNGLQTYVHVHQ